MEVLESYEITLKPRGTKQATHSAGINSRPTSDSRSLNGSFFTALPLYKEPENYYPKKKNRGVNKQRKLYVAVDKRGEEKAQYDGMNYPLYVPPKEKKSSSANNGKSSSQDKTGTVRKNSSFSLSSSILRMLDPTYDERKNSGNGDSRAIKAKSNSVHRVLNSPRKEIQDDSILACHSSFSLCAVLDPTYRRETTFNEFGVDNVQQQPYYEPRRTRRRRRSIDSDNDSNLDKIITGDDTIFSFTSSLTGPSYFDQYFDDYEEKKVAA